MEKSKIVCFCKGKGLKAALALVIIIVIVLVGYTSLSGGTDVEFRVLSESEIPQEITAQVIPQYRSMERALACVVNDKVYVIASRGEKPSTGYDINIVKMELLEEEDQTTLLVYTDFRDPQPGLTIAQDLTYPLQVAETDLTVLPDKIELKVQYGE